MANIGKLLKDEIRRLAASEARKVNASTQASLKNLRQSMASLKEENTALKKQVRRLQVVVDKQVPEKVTPEDGERVRVTGKGVASLRRKWGVSAADFGAIVGVSPLTVYNWEKTDGALRMRGNAKEAYLACRGMSKREALERLEEN